MNEKKRNFWIRFMAVLLALLMGTSVAYYIFAFLSL